jgi:error-prone DNA polymerase
MFQVESRAQMSCLPRLRPQKFYDIVVQVAIIRPGPIVGNMVHPYLNRRLGRAEVVYPHPSLEPVLRRTLGVPLFQEQLLKMAMICADFSGGEAEELRRAFGFKRSEARMKEIEVKLRRGMERNGISRKSQDEIVQAITSFALYGFPESHAASFALIAYASAYLKCHYLAAFTAAILNNQPMGFYQPFTIIKDAQRHGLKVLPVDVMRSDWLCTIEHSPKSNVQTSSPMSNVQCPMSGTPNGFDPNGDAYMDQANVAKQTLDIGHWTLDKQEDFGHWTLDKLAMRLGFRYVKGLSEKSGQAIVRARSEAPFSSIDDLHQRVPELRKDELRKLAAVGALNFIQGRTGIPACHVSRRTIDGIVNDVEKPGFSTLSGDKADRQECLSYTNRRDALWQVERVTRPAGELYEELQEKDSNSPLTPMTRPERMDADFRGTGLTIGRHPVAFHRPQLNKLGALRAIDIHSVPDGTRIKVGGWVIVRQRPGTAKGFVFLTLEDETGVANIIITPQLFDRNRLVLVDHPFLLIDGALQNQDNVVSVKAKRIHPLSFTVAAAPSHDFH